MKYKIEINGKPYQVEVEEKESIYMVTVDGISYEASIAEEREETPAVKVIERTAGPAVSVPPPVSKVESAPGAVTAPMPGTILKVHVSVGKKVEAGDVLFTLEAMKMENEISSPVSGTAKEVPVKEGQAVNTGDVLVVIS